jgi:Flp pilus assembly protein TadG
MLTRPQSAVRRPGQVIALTAILLLFLTGMVAFTIDTGYIAATRTELQRTADAAALAAVMKLPGHTTLDKARAAAKAEAKNWAGMSSNGSLALLDADIEVVKYTPSAARGSRLSVPANVGEANAVRVRVRKDASANNPLRLFFAPVCGPRRWPSSSRPPRSGRAAT